MNVGDLLRCTACDRYTMQATCPECEGEARPPGPPKFSPEDKYGSYRRKLKRLQEEEAAAVPGGSA